MGLRPLFQRRRQHCQSLPVPSFPAWAQNGQIPTRLSLLFAGRQDPQKTLAGKKGWQNTESTGARGVLRRLALYLVSAFPAAAAWQALGTCLLRSGQGKEHHHQPLASFPICPPVVVSLFPLSTLCYPPLLPPVTAPYPLILVEPISLFPFQPLLRGSVLLRRTNTYACYYLLIATTYSINLLSSSRLLLLLSFSVPGIYFLLPRIDDLHPSYSSCSKLNNKTSCLYHHISSSNITSLS